MRFFVDFFVFNIVVAGVAMFTNSISCGIISGLVVAGYGMWCFYDGAKSVSAL